ncbi:MAG: hypothetical protein Hyperionvirus6_104 [Hyperionvirus sp.]|uniref:Uncharacterized protein n=1 Tax=Hyperionvirus sp. TaxID=2487770 RepID=A0A3G5AC25_9VIRU|nr:MAG: hypothetical protein Hyperionvirus6_104 [Hyperionvirus sp.]
MIFSSGAAYNVYIMSWLYYWPRLEKKDYIKEFCFLFVFETADTIESIAVGSNYPYEVYSRATGEFLNDGGHRYLARELNCTASLDESFAMQRHVSFAFY